MLGRPGTVSGLTLRVAQCVFAFAACVIMASADGFSRISAFSALTLLMAVQTLWSFLLICIDIHALWWKINMRNHIQLVRCLAIGDQVIALLSLGAASSSGGVLIMYSIDMNLCDLGQHLAYSTFQTAVGLAFTAWFLVALSSAILFILTRGG